MKRSSELAQALAYAMTRGVEVQHIYGDWRDTMAAAEAQHVRDFGELPEWAIVIEKWELVAEDTYVWLHRDWINTQ